VGQREKAVQIGAGGASYRPVISMGVFDPVRAGNQLKYIEKSTSTSPTKDFYPIEIIGRI
jgi:hypothetical protein